MNRGTKSSIVAGAVLAMAAMVISAPPVAANDFDQAVKVTFTTPVDIPDNATLPPGTYWIEKVARGTTNIENVMQISNARHTRVVATALLQPVQRREPRGRPFVGVATDNTGAPVALMGWYYPARTIGYELVYSDRQRDRIREETQVDVLVSHNHARVTTSLGGH